MILRFFSNAASGACRGAIWLAVILRHRISASRYALARFAIWAIDRVRVYAACYAERFLKQSRCPRSLSAGLANRIKFILVRIRFYELIQRLVHLTFRTLFHGNKRPATVVRLWRSGGFISRALQTLGRESVDVVRV